MKENLFAIVLRSMRSNTINTLFVFVVQFVQIAAAARLIDAAAWGKMSILSVAFTMAYYIIEWGIISTAARIEDSALDRLRINFGISIFWAVLLGVFFFVLSPVLAGWCALPEDTGLFRFVAYYCLIMVGGLPFQGLLTRKMHFKTLNSIENYAWLGSLITVVILGYYQFGVYALLIGYLIKTLIYSAGCMIKGWPLWQQLVPAVTYNPVNVREIVRLGYFEASGQLLSVAAFSVDRLLIGHLLGTAALGQYALVQQLCMVPMARINPILTKVMLPVFGQVKTDPDAFSDWFNRSQIFLLLINTLLMAGLMGCGREVILLFAGEQWLPALPLLRWLCVATVSFSLAASSVNVFRIVGRTDFLFYWNIFFFFGISAILGLALWYHPTLESAGIAQLIITLSAWWPWYYFLKKYSGLDLGLYQRTVLKSVLLGLLIFGSLLLSDFIVPDILFLRLFIKILIGSGIFYGIVIRSRLLPIPLDIFHLPPV